MPADRLEQFEREIRRLGVKGGNPEPERWLVIVGVVAVVAGFGLSAFGLDLVITATNPLDQGDGLAQVTLGVGAAIVGAVLWARYSLSRYLRYWLIRQVYESRASTDRIVEAIERLR
jgi:drug/metabolite transporter (DMT)-like permease